jgi:CarD family transcriptional regulator
MREKCRVEAPLSMSSKTKPRKAEPTRAAKTAAKPVKKAVAATRKPAPAKKAAPVVRKPAAAAAKPAAKAAAAKPAATKPAAAKAAAHAAPAKAAQPAAKVARPQSPVSVVPAASAPKPRLPAENGVEARMPAKKAAPKSEFKTGEHIVYPAHGVGRIMGIETQEVAGIKLDLFVISFIKDKMTLRVPVAKATAVGMRKLADSPTVKRALETVRGRARIKRTMWSRRAQEYEAKINSGDLISIAEVVRDLYRSESQPEQSYSERQLYEAALDRMSREISAARRQDRRRRGAGQGCLSRPSRRISARLNRTVALGRRFLSMIWSTSAITPDLTALCLPHCGIVAKLERLVRWDISPQEDTKWPIRAAPVGNSFAPPCRRPISSATRSTTSPSAGGATRTRQPSIA